MLAKHDVQVNLAANMGQTALHLAATKGQHKAVTLLLRKPGIQFDMLDFNGTSPLMLAANERHGSVVEAFLRSEQMRGVVWNGWRPQRRYNPYPHNRPDLRFGVTMHRGGQKS